MSPLEIYCIQPYNADNKVAESVSERSWVYRATIGSHGGAHDIKTEDSGAMVTVAYGGDTGPAK
ncbi:hypothetical protein A2Z33_01775 [Candidatus Gottesmanbacteria bacterium RBG_16_52_11]|uniref:Uncharacterized protein n=1 Tax=Candidatus Gottesmanbacteria bacterium RBG_16_52_11 TaxID=1798374 RepID=A0A1F5YRA2_9BACT|nr:MAG: hypothetical protein A2Z33_01775 [Candidatus Gottesmanbacteria bacterium RBG_16_52_11]